MKYKEAGEMIEELFEARRKPLLNKGKLSDLDIEYVYGFKAGMEDIVRVLCDKGVIDNSEEIEREREGGY